jgi:hypothetical protein
MVPLKTRQVIWFGAKVLTTLMAGAGTAAAQNGAGIGGGPGAIGELQSAGLSIDQIDIRLNGTTGTTQGDQALRQQALRTLGIQRGDQWNALLVGRGIASLRALPGVSGASHELIRQINPDTATLAVTLVIGKERDVAASRLPRSPLSWENESAYVRLLLNGGFGVLSDGNPWFRSPKSFTLGNPLVRNPAIGAGTGARASWGEAYVEYGIGGVTRLGQSDLYIYGAVTGIGPISFGREIFRDDTRTSHNLEKAYGGLLYAPTGSDLRINASIGRQNFTLNDGFLIAQYGSQYNAGPRPGLYLAPRTTHDMAALLTIKGGGWTSTSFYLNPNEHEPLESRTQVLGTNLRYSFSPKFHVDATYIHVPRSDTTYRIPGATSRYREGLSTAAGHVRWADEAVAPGLWLEGEVAYQWHRDFPMSAWAGYGTVGYIARQLPWTPSLSYRFAHFSGDKPGTSRYERFDTLFSGGLNEWLQGITINKVLTQGNRNTHRIRFNVSPDPRLNITLDWFVHRADQLNNLGGNPALSTLKSADLGQEWQLATRWAISPNLYFVGVASYATPGRAIKLATAGEAKPWSSLQAQFYWNF